MLSSKAAMRLDVVHAIYFSTQVSNQVVLVTSVKRERRSRNARGTRVLA